jgi:hypothetical protein
MFKEIYTPEFLYKYLPNIGDRKTINELKDIANGLENTYVSLTRDSLSISLGDDFIWDKEEGCIEKVEPKKTIEISESDYNFLRECKQLLCNQNNRCTANPIFGFVYSDRIYGMTSDYSENYIYIY